ncbi:MAG: hypothetical protein LLG09_05955 [Negativicutes bacterium]|nr:hypothetical protein [Negativicutes bacterium]
MKHVFIVNPKAGHRRNFTAFVGEVETLMRRLQLDYEILFTQYAGHAVGLVRERLTGGSESIRFYACGGDGTMNEVLHGAMGQENWEMTVVPLGSGNDFLKCFGKVGDFLNLEALVKGRAVLVDVIKANEHYALNLLNVGLDAESAYFKTKFQYLPGVSGPMAYNLALAFCFFHRYGVEMTIELDGIRQPDQKFILAAFGNGTTYGSGYQATPLAIPTDGMLDACFFRYAGRMTILKYIPFYQRGEHIGQPGLQEILYYGKHRRVRIVGRRPLHVCIDGEFFSAETVDMTMLPEKVAFVIPFGLQPLWLAT